MADDYDSFDEFISDSQENIDRPNTEVNDSIVDDSQKPDQEHDTLVERMDDESGELKFPSQIDDVIKILIATDIHCGYGENKPVINMDSVNTFEEVLQIAVEQNVDMILLGGDLFHENHPSREVQHKVTQLLRKYCLNGNPISLEFLSDASVNFNQSLFDRVNYYDENINVGLPIFTIHGNHDDMAGKGLTALDLLHESGLVNLFGKHENIKEYQISPILLRKGDTRLALYGLGSQRDDRLVRAFEEYKVKFMRPSAGAEDWFNLFVLHQNRPRRSVHRSTGSYLPEKLIPNFLDLVVWGHEHESKPQPQYVASSEAVGDGFYILQPGSTVATSLTEDEALQKHVFLVKIKGRKFCSKPIPLKTTRPMVVEELVLDTIPRGMKTRDLSGRPKDKSGQYLDEMAIESKLSEMIKKANDNRGPKQPELPLLRLKVVYEGDWANVTPANGKRIGMRFDQIVANSSDMIAIKRKNLKSKENAKVNNVDEDRFGDVNAANLQNIINDYFQRLPIDEKMTVLKPSEIGKALEQYADVEDTKTMKWANVNFDNALKSQVDLVRSTLRKMPIPVLESEEDFENFEDLITKDLMDLKKNYYEKTGEAEIADLLSDDNEEMRETYAPVSRNYDDEQLSAIPSDDEIRLSDDDNDEIVMEPTKKPAARGRGRGRGRGVTRGTDSKKKKITSFF